MIWEDVLIGCPVDTPRLQDALAATFSVPAEQVCVVDDIEDSLTLMQPTAALLVQRTPLDGGEFPVLASIYVRDDRLSQQASQSEEAVRLARRLSAELACDCLISDDDINPYTMLRVRPTGEIDAVTLEADALDQDQYVVSSSSAVFPVPTRTSG